ncbi:GMC family oxidoreductase [Rhodoplanes sp. Z2-YC6860]|uniref:GMC family oxidoreductase n=1 Tax=Rhodoplanes sp. Z2-YC6860 TaxID=674703 RepID=UPI00078DD41C|nr:GMC family oxidoreductase [Rhodoplanes sp. Z2-YC6860]AMN40432.1 gluconate 2-dehydrogenase flavoprotein subunit [Rhodoplanes sp. Z2-YC6860]
MTKRLPKKDVVIIGLGWTGSIMAHELTDEGLDVVAIERGPWRDAPTDFPPTYMQDELRYRVRHELFLRPDQLTFSFRNKIGQTALPIRSWGAFMPPNGVGGGGVHWNAETWRFLPSDFVLKTHLTQRYGASFLPEDMTIQDWGVTYDELETHYDAFEYLCGTSGTAGNLKGQIQEGGNPFEGPRSRPYPTPAQKQPWGYQLFAKAARELGYKPFPQPSGNLSQAYTNTLGLQMGPCTYCGHCEWFGCANYSKASPQTTLLPALVRKSNFTARDNSEVVRINTDRSGKHATGVTFVDTSGEEWEQPADLVILSAYSLFNVQLLLHSGIGQPYDPEKNTGVIGRNFTHQTISSVNGFFDHTKYNFNPFVASGSIGMCVDEFNGDNFDHGPHGFVGGGYVGHVQTGARPIESTLVPPGTPKWGAAWKKAVKENYLSTVKPGTGVHGSFYAYRDVYLDLDPTYKDRFDRPLMRMTIDLHDNEVKQNKFLTDKFAEIIKAMGAKAVAPSYRTAPYDMTTYQTTHLNGGAIMGTDPTTSAVNKYLQHWDVSNLFVLGASAFPQNAGYNPTGTVAALAFWAASAIRNRYLKNTGPLIHV